MAYCSFLSLSFLSRFQVKKKQFFRNFMTITLFGAIGTLISFSVISLGKLFPSLNFTWHVVCAHLTHLYIPSQVLLD